MNGWSFNTCRSSSSYTSPPPPPTTTAFHHQNSHHHNRRRDSPRSSTLLYATSEDSSNHNKINGSIDTTTKFTVAAETELQDIIVTTQRQEQQSQSTLSPQQQPEAQQQQVLYYEEEEQQDNSDDGGGGDDDNGAEDQRRIVSGVTTNNEECLVSFDVPAPQTQPLVQPTQEIDLHGLEELAPLERQMLRMEGLEPYVLVSVLSSTTSYGTITGTAILKNGAIDLLSTLLLATSTVSTVCGVYSTVVFSMCILYGKTALGLDKEDAYYYFMEATSLQRFRGFKAFSYSLLLFVIDIFLIGVDKMPDEYQVIGGLAAVLVTVFGYFEFETILEGAAPMFTGIIPGQDEQQDEPGSAIEKK